MGFISDFIVLEEKEEILCDMAGNPFDSDTPDTLQDNAGICLIDVAYIRVSTEKQAADGYGLLMQRKDIIDWCQRNDVKNCILIQDDGFTGTVMQRPGLDTFTRRLSRLNNGIYDKNRPYCIRRFIIPRLDRLGRTLYGTLQFIQDYLLSASEAKMSTINTNKRSIGFVSCKESCIQITVNQFGVVDPTSTLMLQIFAAFAEFDRNQIVTKLKSGRKEHVASGYPLGGGKKPFGYRYVKQNGIGNYETVPEEKAKFLEARRMFVEEHLSPAAIAETLNLSTEQLVIQMMKRRTYLNRLSLNGEEYEGHFEPFITEEQWQEQQDEFAYRAKGRSASTYVLTSLLYCGNCGAKMRYQKSANGKIRLVCYSQEKSATKKHLVKDENCPNTTRYYAEDVENHVFRSLFQLSYQNDANLHKSITAAETIKDIESNIRKEQAKMGRYMEMRVEADVTSEMDEMYRKKISECGERIKKLEKMRKNEVSRQENTNRINKAKSVLANLEQTWAGMNNEEKRTVCRSLIEKIVITHTDGNPTIDIDFKFADYLKRQHSNNKFDK